MPTSTKRQKIEKKMTMSYNMMIGYDVYDCFTMEHFRLRQRMTLTTKIYCSRLYVLKSSEVSGFAAEMACKRKHSKYSSIISSNYVFKGLAYETLGPWCKEATDFINVIGNRLIAESGDSKSKKFLFERTSLAIQRGNAASIRGTFPDSAILSEIFVL
jgi:hypothetical protein